MLTSGGDRRISVPRGGNTNLYGASPFPRSMLSYAASTANDISLAAFRHLEAIVAGWPTGGLLDAASYRASLENARHRLRVSFDLSDDLDIVFAPSGTDLEFVALALAKCRHDRPVTNVLLGQHEIGSGCASAASGRYFASETALSGAVAKGAMVEGLGDTDLVQQAVRDIEGQPIPSIGIASAISDTVFRAAAAGRHALIHVVHGSKTGLVLPGAAEIDMLRVRHGDAFSLVVDACQARIDPSEIRSYLARDAIVLLTGSKFMGGPPFSGFALVPAAFRPRSPMAAGLATLFRRSEWPLGWRGCDHLPSGANPGLTLRLEAALFELERYIALPAADRDRVIARFGEAVGNLADRLGARFVEPAPPRLPLHRATLATLDLSDLPSHPDFDLAQRWCRVLAARGIRLGQPVKYARARRGSNWSGTLRVSLSMPLIAKLAPLDDMSLASRFHRDMAEIADVLEAAQRPLVA